MKISLHVNDISYSCERWTPRLSLRETLKVMIRKWFIATELIQESFAFLIWDFRRNKPALLATRRLTSRRSVGLFECLLSFFRKETVRALLNAKLFCHFVGEWYLALVNQLYCYSNPFLLLSLSTVYICNNCKHFKKMGGMTSYRDTEGWDMGREAVDCRGS